MQELVTELAAKQEQYLYHLEMTFKLSNEMDVLLAKLSRDMKAQPKTGYARGEMLFLW